MLFYTVITNSVGV